VLDGEAPPAATQRAAARHDLDIAEHRSRVITAEMIESADLVAVMTNQHARQTIELVPSARQRVFTLKELPRIAPAVDPRSAGEALADWLERLDAERGAMPHVGVRGDNDVDDPYGRPDRVHRRVAAEVVDLVDQLVECTLIEKEPST